jgi:EAL domain-containing protein (putative c-di-GMP-specific phosphodiesterase class I)
LSGALPPQNATIVRAVAAMGRSLQMRVVAEGVETESEADRLLDLDCDELQGFLIAGSMSADDVLHFLDGRPGAVTAPLLRQIA